jgi:hypothetical protein
VKLEGRMNRAVCPATRKYGSDRRLRARGGLAIRRRPTVPCAPCANQLFCAPLQWLVLKCPRVAGSEVHADKNAILREERDILRKAIAIFSRRPRTSTGS